MTDAPETFPLTDAIEDATPDQIQETLEEAKTTPSKPVKAKKSTKKKEPKVTKTETKKTAPKPPKPKKEKKPAGRKPTEANALRKMQVRALKALEEANATNPALGITIEEMAKRAKIGTGTMRRGLGAVSIDSRVSHDAREGFRSLLTRGMVKVTEVGGENVYYLGPLGEKKAGDIEESIKTIGKPKSIPYSVNPEPKRPTKKKTTKKKIAAEK